MTPTQQILNMALALPTKKRADLAYKLLLSLEDEPIDPDFDWQAAWLPEIERRAAEIEQGKVKPVDARKSIANARRWLDKKRKRS